MNLKTTVFLAVLAVAGGVTWLVLELSRPEVPVSKTLEALEKGLNRDKITAVEIRRGPRVVELKRGPGGEWSLPGNWPVRQAHAERLVEHLSSLRPRFEPIPLGQGDELKYGLGPDAVKLTVTAGGETRSFTLGQKPDDGGPLGRPTYLRLGNEAEVVRLGPGVLAELDRPVEYYQQRRLFPSERVPVSPGDSEKVERLLADTIRVEKDGTAYTLSKQGDEWEVRGPISDRDDPKKSAGEFRDRANPDRVRELLTAMSDVWVEGFVDSAKKTLADFDLEKPGQTVEVTRPGGGKTTLLVGSKAKSRIREVLKSMPPKPGFPPLPPRVEKVEEEYRYARLADNPQVFEVKADTLRTLAAAPATLRDPQLARFRPEDVRRIDIEEGGRRLAFTHDKDGWHMKEPLAVPAEREKVTELLSKLAGLEARDRDVTDLPDKEEARNARLKEYGLDAPAKVKLTVEDGSGDVKKDDKGAEKPREEGKTREITFLVGKSDPTRPKLYVQVAGRDRVSAVEDGVTKLLERPALAYRGRKVLDVPAADLARVEVRQPGGSFVLEQDKTSWRLTEPVKAETDADKVEGLARELARLEAVEFIDGNPSKKDLEEKYGLEKPGLLARVEFAEAKKKAPVTLELGKERSKGEFYARLLPDPAVFVVKKDVQELLARDALAYRPLELWRLAPDAVAEVEVTRGESKYRLKRDGADWKLSGPFDATAEALVARDLADELASPRAEKYVAFTVKEPEKYGLATPHLRVVVTPAADKVKDKDKQDKASSHILLVGGPVEKEGKKRYGQVEGEGGVFVLGEKAIEAIDRGALDLLDRRLLSLDEDAVQRVAVSGEGRQPFALQRLKDVWQLDAGAVKFAPDRQALDRALDALRALRAETYAAYGPKVDLAEYGLDRPAVTVSVTVLEEGGKDKPGKPREYTVALGKESKAGGRYARVGDGPGVAVLAAGRAADLDRTYLDFADRDMVKLAAGKVKAIKGNLGGTAFEARREGDGWKLVAPAGRGADRQVLDRLAEQLAGLRAARVAAYPAKDFREFGLDNPTAVLTLEAEADGEKAAALTLHFGKPAEVKGGKGPARYARLTSSDTVFVVEEAALPIDPAGSALQLQDRQLAKLPRADRVIIETERDKRRAVFNLLKGDWHLTDPVAAESEDLELDEVVKRGLEQLRADELVADKAGDLKEYGLDRPATIWRLYEGEKELLTLLVGGEGKAKGGEPRRYAKLAGSDLVFLLSPDLSKKLLMEYRNRKVWQSPDAVQVDRLEFGHAQNPFTLIRVEDGWKLRGKPANEDAVRDALDALAGLQAERFVADKAAPGDLKLYGLDPPQLALTVSVPGGKRVLHIGRQEGETGRYYALVPGPQGGAVFVIPADRARRIVRPMQAFAEAKK